MPFRWSLFLLLVSTISLFRSLPTARDQWWWFTFMLSSLFYTTDQYSIQISVDTAPIHLSVYCCLLHSLMKNTWTLSFRLATNFQSRMSTTMLCWTWRCRLPFQLQTTPLHAGWHHLMNHVICKKQRQDPQTTKPPSTPCLCLEILPIKCLNWISNEGQHWLCPTPRGNESGLLPPPPVPSIRLKDFCRLKHQLPYSRSSVQPLQQQRCRKGSTWTQCYQLLPECCQNSTLTESSRFSNTIYNTKWWPADSSALLFELAVAQVVEQVTY